MVKLGKRFLQDFSGATAIEYGLVAGLVSVVILATLGTLGTRLSATFSNLSDALN